MAGPRPIAMSRAGGRIATIAYRIVRTKKPVLQLLCAGELLQYWATAQI
jgi:hypothetical protein